MAENPVGAPELIKPYEAAVMGAIAQAADDAIGRAALEYRNGEDEQISHLHALAGLAMLGLIDNLDFAGREVDGLAHLAIDVHLNPARHFHERRGRVELPAEHGRVFDKLG